MIEPLETWLAQADQRHAQSGRPLVSLCYAQSLDGCLAVRRGRPTALSGPSSTRFTHWLRAAHDAILAGVGTVLADDPLLTVRLVDGDSPQPVILDSRLRTPLQARLLRQHPKPAWIAASSQAPPEKRAALEAAGARLLSLQVDPQGRLQLPALLDCLGALGIRRLMVEGGARVITSFLAQGLVDLAVVTIAPLWLGGLSAIEATSEWLKIQADFPRLRDVHSHQLGEDTVIMGRLH